MQRATIELCLEMLGQVSVPVSLPDAATRMQVLVAARQDLEAALGSEDGAAPDAYHQSATESPAGGPVGQ